jgi:predicted Zn-dependent protease
MASDNNKAKTRQAKHSGPKYAAQYGITFNNKVRALNAKIAEYATSLNNATLSIAAASPLSDNYNATIEYLTRKQENLKRAIETAKAALKSVPLKR